MVSHENKVEQHYSHGSLLAVIQAGLQAMQTTSDASPIALLAGVDEFHMGGRVATKALADHMQIDADHHVLDVGCGLGGTARYLAETFGCKVSGVDLTAEYVEVGNRLNADLSLSDQIALHVANATDMPFEDAHFDRASMLHVGMNIADKPLLLKEIARVTRSGSRFALYDVMRTGPAPLAYPVAWADEESTSFVGTPDDYRDALDQAGFDVVLVEDKRDLALQVFAAIRARMADGGQPPLGLHIVMGKDAPVKIGNMRNNIQNGAIAPVQMIARRR